VALSAHASNRVIAQQMVRLARASLDLQSRIGGDGVHELALDLKATEEAFAHPNTLAAGAAVASALRAVDSSASSAAFESALQGVEHARGGIAPWRQEEEEDVHVDHIGDYEQSKAGIDSESSGTEAWAWRRLAHLEVGLGLESVQSSQSAPRFPAGVLSGLGDLAAHLERGEIKPGETVLLKNAANIMSPRSHAMPVNAQRGHAYDPLYQTMTAWWPGK